MANFHLKISNLLLICMVGLGACQSDTNPFRLKWQYAHDIRADSLILSTGNTIMTRFPVPAGFARQSADTGSYTHYLRNLTLYPVGHQVHLFDGSLKGNQSAHCAVLTLDVGSRDLQQCADAVIRLRAEYLFQRQRYEDIHFNFTNGFLAEYTRWRKGDRIRVSGNTAVWVAGNGQVTDTYADFRKFLDLVFTYAGTASLARALKNTTWNDLQPGDVLIQGGSPGHAVMVMDIVEKGTEKRFLLAQSYMPAQEIHILNNPGDPTISPWYAVSAVQERIVTPEWQFKAGDLKRFE